MLTRGQVGKVCVKLSGLDEKAKYIEKNSKTQYSGSYLMNVGLFFECSSDFESKLMVFENNRIK